MKIKKYWFVDGEGSGPSPALSLFGQQNTKLPPEMSPFPYFEPTSESSLGRR